MERFEILDISGDIGLRAYGEDIKAAFINAATGMYDLITNLDAIEEKRTIDVLIEGDSIEGLLVSWLNELIFHFDAYGFIGKEIIITEFTPTLTLPPLAPCSSKTYCTGRGGGKGGGEADQLASMQACKLKASISGEDFDPERHESKLLVKAATYHRLRIEKKGDKWEIDVIFDI